MTDANGYLRSNIEFVVDELKLLDRAALAEGIGISATAVGQLIRGESKGLKPSNLIRAANRLGVTAEELVTYDFRKDEWLQTYLRDLHSPGIRERPATYKADRVRLLLERLTAAARTKQLDLPGLEHIEKTVDLLLPKK